MNRIEAYESMNNTEVVKRYRLDKGGIDFLNQLYGDELCPKTLGPRNISSIEKLLITLRFYASGQFQLNGGDIHNVSQPTVSRVIAQVTSVLTRPESYANFIKFPMTAMEVERNKMDFMGIANFPNVIGLIDGTQIQIQAPRHEEESYVNRMGYHSINTQIITDGQDKVIDLVARWPGATHDSRMLRESGVLQLIEGGHVQMGAHGYLLGDSGYPCKKWLMTPYLNPAPGSQTHYNSDHKKTRAKVERAFGQLKKRWGVLHTEIRLQPKKACRVIMACGVLHNICKDRGIPLIDNGQPPVAANQPNQVYQGRQNGLTYRDFVANTFF